MSDEKSIQGGDRFPLTRWSVIDAARSSDEAERVRAMDTLCAAYWKPVQTGAREGTDSTFVRTWAGAGRVAAETYVFDDPVSSLDHRHRDRVAERLAEEGKTRQVVVFTHDMAFLLLLDEACRPAKDRSETLQR